MLAGESIIARAKDAYSAIVFYADVARMTTTTTSPSPLIHEESRATIVTFFRNPNFFSASIWDDMPIQNVNPVRIGLAINKRYRIAFAPGRVEEYPTPRHLIAALGRDGMILRVLCGMPGNALDTTNAIVGSASADDIDGTKCYKVSVTRDRLERWIWIDDHSFLIRKVRDKVQSDDDFRLDDESFEGEPIAITSLHVTCELDVLPDGESTQGF